MNAGTKVKQEALSTLAEVKAMASFLVKVVFPRSRDRIWRIRMVMMGFD